MPRKTKSRHHRRATAPSRSKDFNSAIASIEYARPSSGRTGLEPALKERPKPAQPLAVFEDPRVSYLRSGAWADPLENLPTEFIGLAVQQARLVIVDDDLDHGAVLAYDRAKFDVPVVLLPLLSPYDVGVVRDLARDHGVAVYANDKLAWTLADLSMFGAIPAATWGAVAEILVTDEHRRREEVAP
jgi:type III secretion system FlhB-like substrate exporter